MYCGNNGKLLIVTLDHFSYVGHVFLPMGIISCIGDWKKTRVLHKKNDFVI